MQAVEVAIERAAEVQLAREIAAVADPYRMRARAEGGADIEAFEVVLDRLPPHRRIRVAEAAEFIRQRLRRLILKGVGIHRIEVQPARLGGRAQLDEVGGLVPGDVQRDAGSGLASA